MDSLVALLISFHAWRTAVCLVGGLAVGFLVAALVAPVPGLIVALGSIGAGLLWEASAGRIATDAAIEPAPPMSWPIAFLGTAFLGVFLGGFVAELMGSVWAAVAVVIPVA